MSTPSNVAGCDFCQRTETTLVPDYHLDKPRMICAPGTGCNEDMGGGVVCGLNGRSPRCVAECTYPSCSCAADTLRAIQAAQAGRPRWLTLDEHLARAAALDCGPAMVQFFRPPFHPRTPLVYPPGRLYHVVLIIDLPGSKTKGGE